MASSSNDKSQKTMETPSHAKILNRDEQRSAFSPYKAATVLTNLQRGNVQAKTPTCIPDRNIHQLAAQGELFSTILENLVDIDIQDENGLSPLHWAANHGQLTTVKLLLDRRANINLQAHSKETPLHFAANKGHTHVVKELLNRGADFNLCDEDGNTPLMFAVHHNHVICVHDLLAAGADFTIENMSEETAYSLAIQRKNKQAQQVIERFMLKNVFKTSV